MPDTPFGQLKRVSRPTEHHIDVEAMLADRVPEFQEAGWAVTYEQLALVAQLAGDDTSTHESVRLLFNLAVNDFRDLLHDLDAGSGRLAMRAARAVIEHAINLHTVAASLADASRYLAEPDLPDWVEEQVAGLIDMAVATQSHLFRPDQRWLTASIQQVTVTPEENARPIPDTALMEFPPDDWEVHEIGRVGSDKVS